MRTLRTPIEDLEAPFERLDQDLLRRQIELDGCASQGEVIDFRRLLGELKDEVLNVAEDLEWR